MRRSTPPLDAALEEELRTLYRDVDALYAGWSCPASTDCCHFGRTGREPYVTSVELALMKKALAGATPPKNASPKNASPKNASPKKALPVLERRCPLLTAEGR